MKRVFHVAVREFVVTVSNRAFIVGLLVMPALIAMLRERSARGCSTSGTSRWKAT